MMSLIVLVLFLFIAIFSWIYNKSIVDPAFITSGLWFFLLCIYNFIPHGLYPLSYKFYLAITLWVVPFCSCSLLFSKINFKVSKYLLFPSPGVNLYRRLLPILLVIDVIIILNLYKLGGSYSSESISAGVRTAMIDFSDTIPPYIKILLYFIVVNVSVIFSYMYTAKAKSLGFRLLVLLQVVIILFLGNKGGVASFLFAIIFLGHYHNKLGLKRTVLLLTALIGFITVVATFRGDNKSITTVGQYLSIYVLSPLPAFDMILNGKLQIIPGTPGALTFESFFQLFNAIGIDVGIVLPSADWWVSVPVPTNVFTHMATFYVDFGYPGIFIFAVFFGISWGILYNMMNRRIVLFAIIYSIFFYTLFLTFFADYVFTFLSLSIQYLFVSYLLFLKFKR